MISWDKNTAASCRRSGPGDALAPGRTLPASSPARSGRIPHPGVSRT